MAFYDENTVVTPVGVIVWDGVSNPEKVLDEKGVDTGKLSYNLRIAVPQNDAELNDIQAIVVRALQNSKYPNVNPSNPGNNPVSQIDTQKFPELPGHVVFTASTRIGMPAVVDAQGKEIPSMVYGKMFYNGCKVRLLVDAYTYDKKSKGVNLGLQGIQIIDASAPRLSIGAGTMNAQQVGAAFGGTKAPVPQQNTTHAPAAGGTQSYSGYRESVDDAPPPPADDAPPPPAEFPPEGWKPNPKDPRWFYKPGTNEPQLKEADLRARYSL